MSVLRGFFVLVFLVAAFSVGINADYSVRQFVYDANGNLKQDDAFSYEYNSFNQLASVRLKNDTSVIVEEYLYDHEGNRIYKREPLRNQTTYYWNKNFVQVVNDSGTFSETYYYDGDTLVGRKDAEGNKYFYHPDHLGSTTLVTNESGAVVEETNYEPYGQVLYDGKSRYLYTGKEKDAESGLYYYGARYYDPNIARFIQPDSLIPNPYTPQYLNRYSYVLNNPYKYVDSTGHYVESFLDLASLSYDLNELKTEQSTINILAVTADVATLLLPGAVAGGTIVKQGTKGIEALSKGDNVLREGAEAAAQAANKVEQSAEAAKTAEKASEAAKVGAGTDNAITGTAKETANTLPKLPTQKGDFRLTNEATKQMEARRITAASIVNTINQNPGMPYLRKGIPHVGYYDTSSKLWVPTSNQNIVTVYYARRNYVLKQLGKK